MNSTGNSVDDTRPQAKGRFVQRLFLIDSDRLRPIWRCFLSVVLLFSAFVLASEFGSSHARVEIINLDALWQSLVALLAILGSYKIMTAVFERRPLGSMGLAFHSRWRKELARGLAVGTAMFLIAIVLERVGGLAHFTFTPHSVLGAGTFSFGLFAVGAINEEALFRGYPFQRLVESVTPVGAIALTSVLFGLAHLANPHATWISTLNTMLIGIALAIAYLRTRSLWMPIGIHFIWNFLLGFFVGLPVSGLTAPASVLTAHVQGPIWLTGGSYGPEGSLLTTGAILVVTVYVSLAKSIYTSEEMKALVFAPVIARWAEPPITIFPAASGEPTKEK